MKSTFLGIGVQKSATSWINVALKEHPQVCMATPSDEKDKDTRFFTHFYDRGFEWYERHFSSCNETHTVVGEYSTAYFYSQDAPKRIASYNPKMKLIACLRHPVERAFSNHKHETRLGGISGDNLIFENALHNNPMYVYQSFYFRHLSRWLHHFPKEQLLILIHEDLDNDPEVFVKKIYQFLDIDDTFKPSILYKHVHKSRLSRNDTLEAALRTVSGTLKKTGFERLIQYLKKKGLKQSLIKATAIDEKKAFPSMKVETREYLINLFAKENRKLSELIGRNLDFWDR